MSEEKNIKNKGSEGAIISDETKEMLKKLILQSLAIHFGTKIVLTILGFGPWGIIAGTLAAKIMSYTATHNIPLGFLIAFLQSAGAGFLPSIRYIAGTIVFLVHPEVQEKLEKIKQEVAAKLGFNTDKIKIVAKTQRDKNGNKMHSKL